MPNYNVGDLVGVDTSFDNGCDNIFSILKNQEIRISGVFDGEDQYRVVSVKALNNDTLNVEELFETLLYTYELDEKSSLVSEFAPKFSRGDKVKIKDDIRGLYADEVHEIETIDTSDFNSYYSVGGYWFGVTELEDHADIDESSESKAEKVEVTEGAIVRFKRDFAVGDHNAVAGTFAKVVYVYSNGSADLEGPFLVDGELKNASVCVSADNLNADMVELLASDPTKVAGHISLQTASIRVLLAELKSLLS